MKYSAVLKIENVRLQHKSTPHMTCAYLYLTDQRGVSLKCKMKWFACGLRACDRYFTEFVLHFTVDRSILKIVRPLHIRWKSNVSEYTTDWNTRWVSFEKFENQWIIYYYRKAYLHEMIQFGMKWFGFYFFDCFHSLKAYTHPDHIDIGSSVAIQRFNAYLISRAIFLKLFGWDHR